MPARPSHPARIVVSLALLLAIVTPVSATDPSGLRPRSRDGRPPSAVASPDAGAAAVPGQLVVSFAPAASGSARRQAAAAAGGRLGRDVRVPGLALVVLPAGADLRAAAELLARRPDVVFAEPNYRYRFSATPDDPRFAEMWSLAAAGDRDIDAPEAWNVTTGSTDVIVAVVDSGVDTSHPDLAPNIWTNPGETANGVDDDGNGFIDDLNGWDFVAEDNEPEDNIGHGTHVAGTIGAKGNNGQGISGVAWDVSLLPIRAGDVTLETIDIVESFDYACEMGADVVNASFGGPRSNAVRDAIADCPGTLFVAAAGNEAQNVDRNPQYPCAYGQPNIVCVAATDRSDRLAFFSNFGQDAVDIAAPGESILSATPREVLFADGFETSLGAWVRESPRGPNWARTTEAAASGVGSATDSPRSLYQNNANSWIRTAAPIDLTTGSDCILDYALSFVLQPNVDWLLIEGRNNGGPWRVLDSGSPGDLAWTGSSGGAFFDWWEDLTADGFGGATAFDVRFRLETNASGRRNGTYVDDVVVHCDTGAHGTDDFVRFSGTSMAAPHVAGVAALLLSAYPGATVGELKDALLRGGDRNLGLIGRVASGARLNARGALDELDVVRPVAQPPVHELAGDRAFGSDTIPLRVSWLAATDADPSSGIARYQLQRRTKVGSSWRPWRTIGGSTRRELTVDTAPGTHQLRLRARDRGGNWSAYRSGPAFTLADPQGGSAMTFVRRWGTQSSPDFFDGSTRWSRVIGASASHTFTGSQVAWISTRAPNRGRAKVFIDGALVATIDLHRGATHYRRVVFSAEWGTAGPHTIKVKVIAKGAASSGPRVDLDAFVVLD